MGGSVRGIVMESGLSKRSAKSTATGGVSGHEMGVVHALLLPTWRGARLPRGAVAMTPVAEMASGR
jgi:hypothetical protein